MLAPFARLLTCKIVASFAFSFATSSPTFFKLFPALSSPFSSISTDKASMQTLSMLWASSKITTESAAPSEYGYEYGYEYE